MTMVETVRGPVDVGLLGTTLMHEHVFVLNEEIRQNYPGDWDESVRIEHAAAQLNKAVAADQEGRGADADAHHSGDRPVHLERRAVLLPLPD
jgi:predicted metal-dependent phosphotriesterase family hydrolase